MREPLGFRIYYYQWFPEGEMESQPCNDPAMPRSRTNISVHLPIDTHDSVPILPQ